MIIEEWRNLNLPKEKRPEKQPPCIHKSVCCYVDRNTFCFYERKGIHCVHYSTSTRPAPVFTPHIPGKENPNTYRCCEVCPNVLSKPVFRCNCLQPEHDAQVAKTARLEGMAEAYTEMIPVLDARTKAHTTANLRLAGIRLKLRTQQEPSTKGGAR